MKSSSVSPPLRFYPFPYPHTDSPETKLACCCALSFAAHGVAEVVRHSSRELTQYESFINLPKTGEDGSREIVIDSTAASTLLVGETQQLFMLLEGVGPEIKQFMIRVTGEAICSAPA